MSDRTKSVGASEVAALFGCHPWISEYSLWLEKTGLAPPRERTERMRIGLVLERAIFEDWAESQKQNTELGPVGGHWEHNTEVYGQPHQPTITATPDGLWWEDNGPARIVADVKTVDPSRRKDWNNGAPDYYQLQLQQQMQVTGAKKAVVIAAFGFGEISDQWFDADEKVQDQICSRISTFWKRVTGELPPPEVDEYGATTEALKRRPVEHKTVMLSDDVRKLGDCLVTLEANIREREKDVRAIKNKIRAALGNADRGLFANGTGWRIQTISRKEAVTKASTYQKLVRITNDEAEEGGDE